LVRDELNIDEVVKERDEFKDIVLRVQADFENYRKRVSAQTTAEVDRSGGRIIEELLPVLDACEAAVGHGIEGVEPVWSLLLGVLQKQGLEVPEVLRTGYRWKGRVLRAAMVKVKG